jgi:hypothetical protein
MIYPRRKKVIKAFSGLDSEQIDQVDNALVEGTKAIPVFGQAVSAAVGIGSSLGKAIAGDGTDTTRNIIGDMVNPLSSVDALMRGKPLEAIPIVGGIMRGRAARAAKEKLEKEEAEREMVENRKKSNAMFSKLTYEDGGELPDTGNTSSDESVILSGKSHEEGGNPILDDDGNMVAETEKEELIVSLNDTKDIEYLIENYKSIGDDKYLIAIGKKMKSVISKTKDFSKKII